MPTGELLPLAIGIAVRITTIMATVLLLLSPKAKSKTVALLVGCVVGVGGAVALFALLAGLLPTHLTSSMPWWPGKRTQRTASADEVH